MPTVTLTAAADTYVNSLNPNANYGDWANIYAGYENGTSTKVRSLFQFDLSSIPAGSIINSATFKFNVMSVTGAGNVSFGYLTGSWSEYVVTWNNQPGLSFLNAYAFASAGSKSIGSDSYTKDIVQRWVNGTTTNNGIILYEAVSGQEIYVSTRNNGTSSNWPTLTIDYTLPNIAPNAPVLGWSDGQVLNTRTPTVTWTFSDPDGDPQGSYLVEVVNGDYTQYLWTSGWINDTNARAYTIPAGVIISDGQYYIRMKVQDSRGAINQANGNGPDPAFGNRRIIVDITPPTIASIQGYSYSNQSSGSSKVVTIYGLQDNASGIGMVQAYYTPPGGSRQGPFAATQAGIDWYFSVPITVEGEYNVDFYVKDMAGNQAAAWPKSTQFFVDRTQANDPNAGSVYGQTTATIFWRTFSDPTPSSGYKETRLWLGEWDGSNWVGGAPNKYNGTVVTTNIDTLEQSVTGLLPGKRYRYAVVHYDKADNQSAYTWFEFVTKKKIGELRSNGIVLPVYDPASGVLGSRSLRVGTANGVGCFELVPVTDFNASPFRISTALGVKAISK